MALSKKVQVHVTTPDGRRVETSAQIREYAKKQFLVVQNGLGARGWVAKQRQPDGMYLVVFHSYDREVFYRWLSRALERDSDGVPLDLT